MTTMPPTRWTSAEPPAAHPGRAVVEGGGARPVHLGGALEAVALAHELIDDVDLDPRAGARMFAVVCGEQMSANQR